MARDGEEEDQEPFQNADDFTAVQFLQVYGLGFRLFLDGYGFPFDRYDSQGFQDQTDQVVQLVHGDDRSRGDQEYPVGLIGIQPGEQVVGGPEPCQQGGDGGVEGAPAPAEEEAGEQDQKGEVDHPGQIDPPGVSFQSRKSRTVSRASRKYRISIIPQSPKGDLQS